LTRTKSRRPGAGGARRPIGFAWNPR
jgi:hypothetical protein